MKFENEEQLKQFFFQHFKRLIKVFKYSEQARATGEPPEDLAQDILLLVFKNRMKIENIADINAWINRIARNYVIDLLRKRWALKRNPGKKVNLHDKDELGITLEEKLESEASIPNPLQKTVDTELVNKINIIIGKMPKKMQQAFKLHYQGWPDKDIANLLRISVNTVKSHLKKARTRLRDALSDEYKNDSEGKHG